MIRIGTTSRPITDALTGNRCCSVQLLSTQDIVTEEASSFDALLVEGERIRDLPPRDPSTPKSPALLAVFSHWLSSSDLLTLHGGLCDGAVCLPESADELLLHATIASGEGSFPAPPASAEFSLTIENSEAEEVVVTVAGAVDERSTFEELLARLEGSRPLIIDTGGVTHINSYGWKNWLELIRCLGEKSYVFRHHSLVLTSEALAAPQTLGSGIIESFLGTYYCARCDFEETRLLQSRLVVVSESQSPKLPLFRCRQCGGLTLQYEDAWSLNQLDVKCFGYRDTSPQRS